MSKPFYLTTTLPYVNAPLHLGHALEFVRADTIARYKKLIGFDVFFKEVLQPYFQQKGHLVPQFHFTAVDM